LSIGGAVDRQRTWGTLNFVPRSAFRQLTAATGLLALLAGTPALLAQTSSRDRINRIGTDLYSATPHPAEAVTELKAILAVEPSSAEAHMLLGLAYRMQGKAELLGEAVAELRQALAINPDLGLARLSLARIYLDMARPGRARDELQTALERSPSQPQLLTMLAEAERQLGNTVRAIELTRQALTADPSTYQARYYLGLALLDSGDHAGAIREMQQVVQSGSNRAEANLGLGTAYLAAGRTAEAIAAFREAVRLDPSRPDAHVWLARAYRLKGQLPEAARELSVAAPSPASLASLYTNVQVEYHLEEGLLRLAQGRLDDAAAAFEKVLALDAGNGPAKEKLAEVNKRRQRAPARPSGKHE
jgi:Tfp pilus assembly protein PilF